MADYLELWKDMYSYPEYITGNENLNQDIVLNGNAIGTQSGYYLDPSPLWNKLNKIYSNIVNSAFEGARTDAIKMNLLNMDYTNGINDIYNNVEMYPWFNFYGYNLTGLNINIHTFYAGENGDNGKYIGKLFLLINNYPVENSITANVKRRIDSQILEKTTDNGETFKNELIRFTGWWNNAAYQDNFFLITKADNTRGWKPYWDEIVYTEINPETDEEEEVIYYLPNLYYSLEYIKYCNSLTSKSRGLQLLMPQYKRRVEIEDLNKNFWVISQILDAAVNSLWGTYGLIDVVRRLINKINSIENFLGLNDIEKIELLHNGSDDLYFDMYSRFSLAGLQLRLKTKSGERLIDNIFKAHNEKSDRTNSTLSADSQSNLFQAIQEEILSKGNLYDSDIISSRTPYNNKYISLSNVIDALNGRLEQNTNDLWVVHNYTNSTYKDFLKVLDLDSNEILTVKELETIENDVNYDFSGKILAGKDLERFSKYKEGYQYLVDNADTMKDAFEADSCFNQATALISTQDLSKIVGDIEITDDTYLEYGNKQLLILYNEILELENNTDLKGEYKEIGETLYEQYLSLTMNFEFIEEGTKEQKKIVFQSYTNTNGETVKDEEFTFTFILDSNGIPKFKKAISILNGDIWIYSGNVTTLIGSLLMSSIPSVELVYHNNIEGNYSVVKDKEKNDINNLYNYLFDVNFDKQVNIYDAIRMASSANLSTNNNAYNKKLKEIYELFLKFEKDSNYQVRYTKNNKYESVKTFLIRLMNSIKLKNEYNEEKTNWETIKSFFFLYKGTIEENLTSLIKVYQPTTTLIDSLQKITGSGTKIEGTNTITEDEVLKSIKETSYEICGNILLFLYDKDYYVYKPYNLLQPAGLYLNKDERFYSKDIPLIHLETFSSLETYPLFIPRSDLIDGEIIQLRLTGEKNTQTREYVRKMLDFSVFNKNDGFTTIKETEKSNLFLSLYNSFAELPQQYNTKTTLFFKHTTPNNTNRLKKIDDWFQNGIEYQYFKPDIYFNAPKDEEKIKRGNLKIRASMVAKKDPFEDNTFISEKILEPSDSSSKYCFVREQAYCAATRANLTFYSSAARDEKGQFIHSPLQLLQSAGARGDSESIQAKRLIYNYEENVYALDVMNEEGDKCSIEDIKNMLYRNAKENNKPIHVEAIFGGRKVDNYIKKKKLKYIVIEKEPGTRHMLYGPTCVGLSFSNGYLSAGDGLTSIKEVSHTNGSAEVKWYDKTGQYVSYSDDGYIIPAQAEYGVVDLTDLSIEAVNNFMIRFYTADRSNWGTKNEFITNVNGNFITRRPIFKMAYFFGEDDINSKND